MRKIIAVVCMAALATCAYAEVGSVISSFYIGKTVEPTSYFAAIYRDPAYVYSFWNYIDTAYLRTYTPSGSQVNNVYLASSTYPGDMTGCHLGAPYFAFSGTESDKIYFARTDNASVLQSFPAKGPGGRDPYDIMWDGRYYHVHSATGVYNLYTPAGALAGQWTVAGWPAGMRAGGSAFSKSFNNAGGRYLFVVSSRDDLHYVFNMGSGSLLASWGMVTEYSRGQNYGDAYPASYGGALWYHGYLTQPPHEHWAYQIDVNARGAASVVPASIGKIKAIYR